MLRFAVSAANFIFAPHASQAEIIYRWRSRRIGLLIFRNIDFSLGESRGQVLDRLQCKAYQGPALFHFAQNLIPILGRGTKW